MCDYSFHKRYRGGRGETIGRSCCHCNSPFKSQVMTTSFVNHWTLHCTYRDAMHTQVKSTETYTQAPENSQCYRYVGINLSEKNTSNITQCTYCDMTRFKWQKKTITGFSLCQCPLYDYGDISLF